MELTDDAQLVVKRTFLEFVESGRSARPSARSRSCGHSGESRRFNSSGSCSSVTSLTSETSASSGALKCNPGDHVLARMSSGDFSSETGSTGNTADDDVVDISSAAAIADGIAWAQEHGVLSAMQMGYAPPGQFGPPGDLWALWEQADPCWQLACGEFGEFVPEFQLDVQPDWQFEMPLELMYAQAGDSGSCVNSPPLASAWTTVMLRNLPNDYTREMVLDLLDSEGFWGLYRFLYLPLDFRSGSAFGYAFVDFNSPEDAHGFREAFQGFRRWSIPSRKIADVTWSRPTQGLQMNVDRYCNNPVMHPSVPDHFKPVLFEGGVRVAFPPPTRVLAVPPGMAEDPVEQEAKFPQDMTDQPWTTLMFRNLPNDYTRSMLLALLDRENFSGRYDFVYLPVDFSTTYGVGYAFINATSQADADSIRSHFSGFSSWEVRSRKVAEVMWSTPNQGLLVHIQRYRNSAVMREGVPDEWKPALFSKGCRIPFPAPLQAPRCNQTR